MGVFVGIVTIGMPYSGKSTHLGRFALDHGYPHYDIGAMLRAEIATESKIGRYAKYFVARGRLVPDEMIHDLIMPTLDEHGAAEKPFVLIGHSRDESQARELGEFARSSRCSLIGVHIDITHDEAVRRFNKGREETATRSDDNSVAKFQFRLTEFEKARAAIPTLRHACVEFLTVSGTGRTVDDVYDELSSRVGRALHDVGHIPTPRVLTEPKFEVPPHAFQASLPAPAPRATL